MGPFFGTFFGTDITWASMVAVEQATTQHMLHLQARTQLIALGERPHYKFSVALVIPSFVYSQVLSRECTS
jgi:hypothetical protein